MKKTEKISINSPCSLTYESFQTLNKNSKYCLECRKNIQDFSEQKMISESTHCGLFSLSQIDMIMSKKRLSNLLKPISLATILGLSLNPVFAQNNGYVGEKSTNKQVKETAYINGKLTDKKTGKPLPFIKVSAIIENKEIFTINSDYEGKFTLKIDTSKYNLSKLYIHFNNEHYESDTILYSPLDKEIQIELEANVSEMDNTSIRSLGRVAKPQNWINIDGEQIRNKEYKRRQRREKKELKQTIKRINAAHDKGL